jgi:hypothetical protein
VLLKLNVNLNLSFLARTVIVVLQLLQQMCVSVGVSMSVCVCVRLYVCLRECVCGLCSGRLSVVYVHNVLMLAINSTHVSVLYIIYMYRVRTTGL